MHLLPGLKLTKARNNELTAKYNGALLHSAYNPTNEAKKRARADSFSTAQTLVFYGFGLGYLPNICAGLYSKKNIVLIEPDPLWVLVAFSAMDWSPILAHTSCVFLLHAPQNTIIQILENFGLKDCSHILQPAQITHNSRYFQNIRELVKRNVQKQDINSATLDRFSHLWLRNLCRNIHSSLYKHAGICKFKNILKNKNLPAIILAAGPSLEKVLPYLSELKKRCIIICVDTALKACLRAGVQPDFIVLVDPQYWNARHLDRLSAPESILITESAAYPPVFRFKCKEIILCTSMFPLGQYIEKHTGTNGKLAAGGSVASSAWDFARYIGCSLIVTAGLDLGFPNKKTHIKGSTFEEHIIQTAHRLSNTETANTQILHNISTNVKKDYNGYQLATDTRMNLYAWWFESKVAQHTQVQTKTLTAESLAIPGISMCTIEEILQFKQTEQVAQSYLNSVPKETKQSRKNRKKLFNQALGEIHIALEELFNLITQAIELCNATLETFEKHRNVSVITQTLSKLDEIDVCIKKSKAAPLASLVFPSQKKLETIYKKAGIVYCDTENYAIACQHTVLKSKIMYKELAKTIKLHFSLLFSQVPSTQSDNRTMRMCSSKFTIM